MLLDVFRNFRIHFCSAGDTGDTRMLELNGKLQHGKFLLFPTTFGFDKGRIHHDRLGRARARGEREWAWLHIFHIEIPKSNVSLFYSSITSSEPALWSNLQKGIAGRKFVMRTLGVPAMTYGDNDPCGNG